VRLSSRAASVVAQMERIETPPLDALYSLWESLRRDGGFPAWRDFDRRQLEPFLDNLLLIEVLREPLRFRFRYHGKELAWRAGYDMTGKLVDELPHRRNRAVLLERCRSLTEMPRAYVGQGARFVGGRELAYDVLWVPLSEDGTTVTMLLGALYYGDISGPGRVF
jgi:hypothetical protein